MKSCPLPGFQNYFVNAHDCVLTPPPFSQSWPQDPSWPQRTFWLLDGSQHLLSISTTCISGHIFSGEVEGIQRNRHKGKSRITKAVRVQTFALVLGTTQVYLAPLWELQKGAPLGKVEPCTIIARWVDRAVVEIWKRCSSSEKRQLCPGQVQHGEQKPDRFLLASLTISRHLRAGRNLRDHIQWAYNYSFSTCPKESLFFLCSYPLLAFWPRQWRTNQETSSRGCLWCGAKIRSKSAERNGGVWVVHQSAERRDELHQRCESFKDFLFLVYTLSVACDRVEFEVLMWM